MCGEAPVTAKRVGEGLEVVFVVVWFDILCTVRTRVMGYRGNKATR